MLTGDRKIDAGAGKIHKRIFELRAPVRRQADFRATARRPAGAPEIDAVDIAETIRTHRQIPVVGKAAGAVEEPIAEGIADAAAQGAENLDVVFDLGWPGPGKCDRQIAMNSVGKGKIDLQTAHETRGSDMVVAGMKTAEQRTELA